MKSWPLYDLKIKLKLKGNEVKDIKHTNFHQLYFKVTQTNQTKGYSYIHNYPYPKQDRFYAIGMDGKEILFIKNVPMKVKIGQHAGKERIYPENIISKQCAGAAYAKSCHRSRGMQRYQR